MKQTKKVLSTPMSRKDFLRVIGVGALTVLGVANFISLIAKTGVSTSGSKGIARSQSDDRSTFGSRKFGG